MRILDSTRILSNMWIATKHLSHLDSSAADIKLLFNDAVCSCLMTRLRAEPNNIYVEFDNPEVVKLLVKNRLLTEEYAAAGNHVIAPQEQELYRDNLYGALRLIGELNQRLHFVIRTLIASVACYRIPDTEGGSISSCVGLIYLNPNPAWSCEFYSEMLVHEFLHNSLFLEDMVRGVFPDYGLFDDEDALAISTLRQTKRPFDKAYHSACVAVGLMYFYHLMGNTRKEQDLIPRLRKTIEELEICERNLSRRNKLIVTENGKQLLGEVRWFADTLDYGMLTEALRS